MMELLSRIADWLGADRYSPYAICLANDTLMLILYVMGNIITAAACLAVGAIFFTRNTRVLVISPGARGLFAAWAALTGLKYMSGTLLLFVGTYRLDIMLVAATAALSVATVLLTARGLLEQTK